MAYIDPATLRRHPVIGVAFGMAAAAALVYVLHDGWNDWLALYGQTHPQEVTVAEAVRAQRAGWIALTDGTWRCEGAVTITQTDAFKRWISGDVAAVEVPIVGDHDHEVVVARFGGAVACAERARSPVSGVVGARGIFGACDTPWRWSRPGRKLAVLEVDATPRQATALCGFIVALLLLAVSFSAYYARLMLNSGEPPESGPSARGAIRPC
jgi:hypothetical protein